MTAALANQGYAHTKAKNPGGRLIFEMGPKRNKDWAATHAAAPPSLTPIAGVMGRGNASWQGSWTSIAAVLRFHHRETREETAFRNAWPTVESSGCR
jgi:hypothetical protein